MFTTSLSFLNVTFLTTKTVLLNEENAQEY